MRDHCFARLGEPWPARGKDYNLCLEGFLLHYRNLIEFFASHGDLKAAKPEDWTSRALSQDEVDSIQNVTLHKKHDSHISRYLSHCNRIRAEAGKGWTRVEMYEEIKPLLENFRKLFPLESRPAVVKLLGREDTSTASVSTASLWTLLESERIALGLPRESGEIAEKTSEQQDDSGKNYH